MIALATGVLSPSVHADECPAPAESVHVTMGRGHATVRVRRNVYNHGEDPEVIELLPMPWDTALTGLRARPAGGGGWFSAGLMDADDAAHLYARLSGRAGGRAGATRPTTQGLEEFQINGWGDDPVLAVWADPDEVSLQLFPIAPSHHQQIEYTLTSALTWNQGEWTLRFEDPALASCDAAALSVVKEHAKDQVRLDDAEVPRGGRSSVDREFELTLMPAGAPTVSSVLERVPLEGGEVVRWRAGVASALGPLPASLDVVVLIDTSRSMGDRGLNRARRAAEGYLAALSPKTLTHVATFDRKVHPITVGPGQVSHAREALRATGFDSRNGSDVEAALAHARDWLDRHGRDDVERRILLVTDLRTAEATTHATARPILEASGALTHIAVVDGGIGAPLDADFDHPWNAAVRDEGGLVWHIADAASEAAEWVRPTRILAPRLEGIEATLPRQLREGEGVSWLGTVDAAPTAVTMHGFRWTEPIEVTAALRRDGGRALAATLAASGEVLDLDDEGLMHLARYGHAVSPVTSLIAVEPGAQPRGETPPPSIPPAQPETITPSVRAVTAETKLLRATDPDALPWLRAEVWSAWRRCGLGDAGGSMELETTRDEIVALADLRTGGADPDATKCFFHAAWDLALPRHRFAAERAHWRIEIEPLSHDQRVAAGMDADCFYGARLGVETDSARSIGLECGRLRRD